MGESKSLPWAVIGGGAAGVAAAAALAERDRRAIVIADGPGASGFFGGSVDVACDPVRQPGRGHKANRNVRTNLIRLIHANPESPYGALALDGGAFREETLMERLGDAIDFFRNRLASVGYGLEGQALSRQKGYVTAFGTVKESNLLHAPHARFSVDDLQGASAAIVGFDGLSLHSAEDAHHMLTGRCGLRLPQGAQVGCVGIRVAPDDCGPSISTFRIADYLESAEGAARLMEEVDRKLAGGGYTHLFFPPAMGLESHEYHLTKIAELSGAQTCEMLGGLSSVPGKRLYQAMTRLLEKLSVECLAQRAVGFDSEGDRITALKLADGTEIEVGGALLASGKYFAGGLQKSDELIEPLFDLPVYCGKSPARRLPNERLSTPNPLRRQPLFEAGVRIDERFRPLGSNGKARWANLYAAGSTLGGSDYAIDHCGMGMAISTGVHAALRACEN